MMSSTVKRVEENTDEAINDRIYRQTVRNLSRFATQGSTEINRRLEELDHEWDVERTLEANAATLALFGIGLGAFVDRRFFLFPALVTGFLLQHAVQGWCPPLPVLRRLGIRTAREIDSERLALKVLRGDFQHLRKVPTGTHNIDIEAILKVVNH
ncbi:MAG: hypothetical protein ACXW37_09265 [Nitrospira sp.]